MSIRIIRTALCFSLFSVAWMLGCENNKSLRMVVVEGTLLLNDKPLPNALIEFMPELKGYGAEMNSTAVTDSSGKFKLMRGNEPGAVVAMHRVVVNEGPPPSGTRGQDAASQAKLTEYVKSLTNRPIPEKFSNYSATPLRVEINEENRNLTLMLK